MEKSENLKSAMKAQKLKKIITFSETSNWKTFNIKLDYKMYAYSNGTKVNEKFMG